jgi:hypothetical protein
MHFAFPSRASVNWPLEAMQVALLVILVFAGSWASAQRSTDHELLARDEAGGLDLVWNQGSVVLEDGTEYTGTVKYNENSGALYFKKDDDLRTLTAKNCVGFEFWDVDREAQRMFISLEYGDASRQVFFEALFQFSSFAVLRAGNMNLYFKDQSNHGTTIQTASGPMPVGGGLPSKKYMYVERRETFFLMSELGEIKPFVAHYEKDRAGESRDKQSATVVNEDFLIRLIDQPAYDDLERFRKENSLEYTNKSGMMKIFEYYRERWSEK